MYNAAIKTILITVAVLSLCGCSNRKEEAEERATILYQEAEQAIKARNYALALSLLDSIDSSCRAATDTRRKVMHLRTAANEGLTVHEIEQTDSLMAVADFQVKQLTSSLQYISNPIEGYYIASGTLADVHGTTGLHARLMKDGTFYLISTVAGRGVGHTSVTVSSGGESATTASVRHDGEQNDRSSGTEIVNYSGGDCDTVPKLMLKHPDATFTVTYNGAHPYSTPLAQSQRDAIVRLYSVVDKRDEHRRLMARKAVLEKRLQIIRSQAARTFVETPSDSSNTK